MKLTFNQTPCNCPTLQADITRLTAWSATARDKRRALARIFPSESTAISIVYDLDKGESPSRAEFEKMAATAMTAVGAATEACARDLAVTVKRSPKYGLVTITIAVPDWHSDAQAMATVIDCTAAYYRAHYQAVYGWFVTR